MINEPRILTVTPQPLITVRRQARHPELSAVIPTACGVVWSLIRTQGLQGAGRHIAVYHANQADPNAPMDLEIGVEFTAPFANQGEVLATATPAGKVVTVTYTGPYAGLREAHNAIHAWCASHGHTPSGVSWELYGHWTDDVSKLQTDVFYLLK